MIKWILRWWIVITIAILSGVILFLVWLKQRSFNGIFPTVLQVSVSATSTVFVGVLARNMAEQQAEKREVDYNFQRIQQQKSELRQIQATAITHISSNNLVTIAAAVTEMVGIILSWDQMVKNKHISVKEGEEHAQELLNLAFKSKIDISVDQVDQDQAIPVIKAKSEGLHELIHKMTSTGIKTGHINLNGARISNALLNNEDLSGLKLQGVHLEHAQLKNAILVKTDLTKASLENIFLNEANLKSAYLNGANLMEAHLEGANFKNASLRGSFLKKAYLNGAILQTTHLEGANLQGAALKHTHVENTFLRGARLDAAEMEGVFLNGAIMSM